MQSDIQLAAYTKMLLRRPLYRTRAENSLYATLEFHVGKYNLATRGPMLFKHMPWNGAYVNSFVKPGGWVQIVFRFRKSGVGEFVHIIPLPDWPYEFALLGNYYRTHFLDMASMYVPKSTSFITKVQEAYSDYLRASQKYDRKVHPRNYSHSNSDSPLRPNPETKTSVYMDGGETSSSAYVNNAVAFTSYSRSYTSTRTPGFFQKKGRQLPINTHSVDMFRITENQGFVSYIRTGSNGPSYWGRTWTRFTAAEAGWDPGAPTHGDNTVWNRAVQKTIDRAQVSLQANLAQDFAQFGQTTRLIVNSFSRIIGSVKALRKGDFPGAIGSLVDGTNFQRRRRSGSLSLTRSLAENWLELQYGWKPLLQDVEGSMRSTAQFIARDRSMAQVRGSAQDIKTVIRNVTASTGTPSVIGHSEEWLKRQVRFGFRFKIDDHLKTYLAQLGFTNPLNLGWEILPFSFVADWALPIGPYLEALSAWDGLIFVDGFSTQFTKQRVFAYTDTQFKTSVGSANEVTYKPYGTYQREWLKLNRGKLTAFPNKRLPNLKNPVSVTHALNLLALVRVMFRTPYH